MRSIHYDQQAREGLLRGLSKMARAVSVTMGPKGRNVIFSKKVGYPSVTKDGVTVAKEIVLNNVHENMGAEMLKEIASKTATDVGDGTTTATVLAYAIFQESMKIMAAGANPIYVKRGIDKAVEAVVKELRNLSCKISDDENAVRNIAMQSSNGDEEISMMITQALFKMGLEAVITIDVSKSMHSSLEMTDGIEFSNGYISDGFMTDLEKMIVELHKPLILLTDYKIHDSDNLVPVMERAATEERPLLIIADEVRGEALGMLVVNKKRGVMEVAAVKSPGLGDRKKGLMGDLAILTGATVISEEDGYRLGSVQVHMMGTCEKVVITRDKTTITGGVGKHEEVQARIGQLKKQIASTTSEYDKEQLQARIAKLGGGVAVIYVGAQTQPEMKEKRDRVEDALCATRAAIEEGIVTGGGVAYIRARIALNHLLDVTDDADEKVGIKILYRALEAPVKQIAHNSGAEGNVVLGKIMESGNRRSKNFTPKGGYGYNARTDTYENLFEAGVVDPLKVVRCALENAASIAGMMITTDCVLVDHNKNV